MSSPDTIPVLILGNRPFAEEIADLAMDSGFQVTGFVENEKKERCRERLMDLPIYWFAELKRMSGTHQCISGLTQRRRYAAQMDVFGMKFARVIHATARVSSRASVGEGSIVSAGCMIAAQSSIGDHVLINRAAIIGHHAVIEDFVNIMPGANVAGCTHISKDAYIGMGSIIINSVKIGEGSIVGAGAVVTKDVPPFVQVVGNPARIVKELATVT